MGRAIPGTIKIPQGMRLVSQTVIERFNTGYLGPFGEVTSRELVAFEVVDLVGYQREVTIQWESGS